MEELSADERADFKNIPFSLENYQNALEIESVYGEEGFSTLERKSIRPTLDVNGFGWLYGEGAKKTVIASKAYAKILMRLVPNQKSEEITKLFINHFTSIVQKG